MPESKVFTHAQVAEHHGLKDLWMIIDKKVYDITEFVDEHPGGEEVLQDEGAKDATEAFNDVGHSEEARALLEKYYIGDLDETSKPIAPIKAASATAASSSSQGSVLRILIPLAVVIAYIYGRFYYFA